MARLIDLSLSIEAGPSDPLSPQIVYKTHEEEVDFFCNFFGCSKSDLPQGLAAAVEIITCSSHAGTHIDAPWHYGPTSEGRKARTIEEMPLDWFFSDGVVLDMRHKQDGAMVNVEDLQAALDKINYELKPLDIVMLQTGADKYWGKEEYFGKGCGLGRDSTLWLVEQGVKIIGTDAWGLDRPFWAIKEEFKRTGRKEVLWEAHYAGVEREYCQIEKLANLDALPNPVGFKVACFPVKISGAGAGWSRVVAFV
jgi:kynurenine formamidase